jgi:hypothetical protein
MDGSDPVHLDASEGVAEGSAGIRCLGVIMRRIVLLAGSSWLAVAAALSTPVLGAEPVPDGGKITVKVTVTATSKGKSDIRSSTIDHSFTGSCVLTAAGRLRGDLATGQALPGDTAAVEQTTTKMQGQMDDAGLEQFSKEMEAKMAACGDDEACANAVMLEAMNDPRVKAGGQIAQENAPAVNALANQMADTNLQTFTPQRCEGTMKVNDRHVTDDPGGEGGMDAYKETVTIKDSEKYDWGLDRWTMTVMGDFKSEQSIFSFRPPHNGQFSSTSTVKGKGETGVTFLPDGVAWPERFGPKPGFLKGGSERLDAPGGQVTVKWTVQRGG